MAKTYNNQELSCQIEHHLSAYSRRSFLKGSVGVAMATSTVMTLGCSSENAINPNLKILTASQQAMFARMTAVLLPTKGTKLTPVDDIPVLANIDHLLSNLPAKVVSDLGGAFTLFEYGSLVMGGHFSRFTRLNDAEAVAYIDAWQNGGEIQRGIVTAMKKMVYASYWRDEKTWPPVEYDGPVSVRWGLPSLGNAPLPVE